MSDALALLLETAREAAEIINTVYATDFSVDYKGPRDPVTAADREANELICRRLAAAFPGVPIVAEESDPESFADFREHERAFFVDPLDGTREFVKKNGEFVVMIGLLEGDTPSTGVVHAPATGVAWAASPETGAFRLDPDGSRHPLSVSATGRLADARVVSTRSHRSPTLEQALEALGVSALTALGSAGLKCVAIADGSADAYVAPARAGSRWDLCAGQAIIEAAGGRMTDAHGDPIDYRSESLVNETGILASNAALHPLLLERLAEIRRAWAEKNQKTSG
jgi:3'(2'), 5'-bisphosphate nucleotidase